MKLKYEPQRMHPAVIDFLVDTPPDELGFAAYRLLSFGMKVHIARVQVNVLWKRFNHAANAEWAPWFLERATHVDAYRSLWKERSILMGRKKKKNKLWKPVLTAWARGKARKKPGLDDFGGPRCSCGQLIALGSMLALCYVDTGWPINRWPIVRDFGGPRCSCGQLITLGSMLALCYVDNGWPINGWPIVRTPERYSR